MSTPIAYRKPKSGRLAVLFVLSIAAHVGLAMLAIWAGNHLGHVAKPVEELDLGMDVTLGEEVQELIVAATPPARPEPPPPEPPPPPPEPEPEPEPPEPMKEPDFPEPAPPPKATPAPKPKVVAKVAPASPAPRGAKVGPTPRQGVLGGNVTEGKVEGTPGGSKVGTQGWKTPRPPYPAAALASRIQGSGAVQISTDGSGNVSSVVITRQINPVLDSNTRSFARSNWKGPPNQTRSVPVIYQIR